ncbi:hypothetical protein ACI3L3_10060 [Desulfobaculum sp. SPO524]
MKKSRYTDSQILGILKAFDISQTCYRYEPKLSAENDLIADWLILK